MSEDQASTLAEAPTPRPSATAVGRRELLAEALALPVHERAAFLEEACPDETLRAELARILAEAGVSGPTPGGDALLRAGPPDFLATPTTEPAQEARLAAGSLAPGSRVGDYEIVRLLKVGGMGAVYVARSHKLALEVALKTLIGGTHADADAIERFRLEARSAARLAHPGIVSVYDVGEADGLHYLVMDLIEGESLAERLERRGPLVPREAARIAAALADALDYAHRRAILHRDVKPSNVLLRDDDGRVLLTDFGLAKDVRDTTALTLSGEVLGTPRYMAPEQAAARTEEIDRRTDVYGVGATLYAMLCARPPFEGSLHQVLAATLEQEPAPPSAHRPEVPRDLDTICLRCLEKEPSLRFTSARALSADLQRFLSDQSILSRPPSLPEKARRWIRHHRAYVRGVLSSLSVAALIVLGLVLQPVWTAHRRQRAEVEARQAALAEAERLAHGIRAGFAGLAAGGADPAAIDSLLAPLAGPGAAQALLERAAGAGGGAWLEGEALTRATEAGLAALAPQELAAAGEHLRARILGDRDQAEAARRARARAYRLAPQSVPGSQALLELAVELAAQGERAPAANAIQRLAQEGTPTPVRARALLERARLAGRHRDLPGARRHALEALALGQLPPALEEEAQVLARVAQRLNGDVTLSVPGRPLACACFCGCGRPELIVRDEEHLLALRLQVEDDELRLQELARHPIPGARPWVQVYEEAGEPRLLVLRTEGAELERTSLAFAPDGFVVRAQERWTCRTRAGPFLWTADHRLHPVGESVGVVNRLTQQLYSIWGDEPGLVHPIDYGDISDCKDFAALDLDGDGREEHVFLLGPWRVYGVIVMGRDAEGRPRELLRQRMGLPDPGLVRPGSHGRPELLINAQRGRSEDNTIVFGPDLSPRLSNAVWRLRGGPSGFRLEQLFVFPFAERHRTIYRRLASLSRLFPELPDAFAVQREALGVPPEMLLVPGPGQAPVAIANAGLEGSWPADVDGDGDLELVLAPPGARLHVWGLAQVAATRASAAPPLPRGPAAAPPTPLDVAEDLLVSHRYGEARAAFEELLAAQNSSERDRQRLLLGLAEALAALGDLSEAREACLSAAHALGGRLEAFFRAAEYAERAGDLRAAQADLLAAEQHHRLPPHLGERVARWQRRLLERLGFVELLRLNAGLVRSGRLNLAVRQPWLFQPRAEGLGLTLLDGARPELLLPVRYDGRSINVDLSLRVSRLEWGTGFALEFIHERHPQDGFSLTLFCGGGGTDDTLQRRLTLRSPLAGEEARIELGALAGDERLEFSVVCDAARSNLRIRLHDPGASSRQIVVSRGLRPGPYALRLAQAPGHYGTPNQTELVLEELTISGPDGAVTPDPRRTHGTLGAAGAAYLSGRPPATLEGPGAGTSETAIAGALSAARDALVRGERAAAWEALREIEPFAPRACQTFRREAEQLVVFPSLFHSLVQDACVEADRTHELAFLRAALSLAHDAPAAAAAHLRTARARDPAGFTAFWQAQLAGLPFRLRQVLAELYGDGRSPGELVTRGRELLGNSDLASVAEAALAFLAADLEPSEHPELGVAWVRLGDLARGAQLLAPHAAAGDASALQAAGLAAYGRGRYARAVELWSQLATLSPGLAFRLERARRLAE